MKPASNMALSNDEYSMIFSNHFGIGFKPAGTGNAPTNDYGLIITCAVQIMCAFVFAMLGCLLPFPFSALCWASAFCMLFFRLVTVGLFALTVIQGRYTKRFYRSSVMFWGWWPMWLFLGVATNIVLGYLVGDYIWTTALNPYWELKKLQTYRDINPDSVPGERVQDAGLVDFSEFVEMDRAKGGCFMNHGNTYCIAPIVKGGEVKYGLGGTPRTGSYDYFAVGINCCTCPNKDFQCGEWNNPLAAGGLRSLDETARPYYKLALDDWQAGYGKVAKNPMFFEWVQEPEWKWKGMWNRACHLGWLAAAFAVSSGLCIGFFLDKILQCLWQHDIVAPRACFAPAPGFEDQTEMLLPKMFYRYRQEQSEIAAMPVSAEWKGQRGPGSAGEDANLAQDYGSLNGNSMSNGLINSVMAPPGATGMGGMGAMGAASMGAMY